MEHNFIHFVGIGGIGMSSLVRYYLHRGVSVTGSDLKPSEITTDLERLGAVIAFGEHSADALPAGTDFVVHTPATRPDNTEVTAARERDIPVMSYPEAVGALTKGYQTLTVSGSHGKTTTTAMTALALEEGYFDPTVIVGAKIKEFGDSNFRNGRGPYLLLEADEWNRSFLNYQPFAAIVTNIDTEHLDTYGTIEEVERTFEEYLSRVPSDGVMVLNGDDERLRRIGERFGKLVRWYSLQDAEAEILSRALRIPGSHNVSNALAAFQLARALGMYEADIIRGIGRFTGAWRRFELKGILNGAFLFSDYGHHPTEIMATINAARTRFPFRRIWCIFQPHQYQRLMHLWNEFLGAFDQADQIGLLPVYDVAGRETTEAKEQVNSIKLAEALQARGKNIAYFESFGHAKEDIVSGARPGDIILMIGAGDIYGLTQELAASCEREWPATD